MFATPNLPILFKNAKLTVNEDNERFAAVTFVLEPFTPALAKELGEDVASHFYDRRGVVRPEFTKIGFQAQPGTRVQKLTVRAAPDAPGSSLIEPVVIDSYEVTKPDPEKERLKLTIAASFSLAEKVNRAFAIDRFGTGIYVSFQSIFQPTLDMGGTVADRMDRAREEFLSGIPDGTSVSIGVPGRTTVHISQDDVRAAKARKAARKGGKRVTTDLFGQPTIADTGERNAFDYYPTPGWMTRSLLHFHSSIAHTTVLEPCSGDGAIVRVLEAYDCEVVTNDLDPRHPADTHQDATDAAYWSSLVYVDWVITNPPFNVAFPVLQHALKTAQVGVALLLRKTFLEPTDERGPWLAEHPPARIIGQPRYSFRGKGSDSVSCDWCIWLRHPGTWYTPIEIDYVAERRIR